MAGVIFISRQRSFSSDLKALASPYKSMDADVDSSWRRKLDWDPIGCDSYLGNTSSSLERSLSLRSQNVYTYMYVLAVCPIRLTLASAVDCWCSLHKE